MRARLFGRYGVCKGMQFDIDEQAAIGRGEDNDIVIEAGPVSKQHARLRLDPDTDRYWLEDFDSLNGTEIDGERLRGEEPLSHLHVLSFGGCELIFQDLVRCAQRHQLDESAASRDSDSRLEPAVLEPAAIATAGQGEDTFGDEEAPALPAALARGTSEDDTAEEEAMLDRTLEDEVAVRMPSFLASSKTDSDSDAVDSDGADSDAESDSASASKSVAESERETEEE